MTKIDSYKKHYIGYLAEYVANFADYFSSGNITLLDKIIEDEEIHLYEDSYGDAFDGALVFENDNYHMHLNKDKGNWIHTTRGRFTTAHELGHYFIKDHRQKLDEGSYYYSNFKFIQKDIMELEADHFAASLLFPKTKFQNYCKDKSFNAKLITDISKSFQTSQLPAIRRYCEIGDKPIFMVYSENNQVKYFKKSEDFPFVNLQFKIGQAPPTKTLTSKFFKNKLKDYTAIKSSYSTAWFDDIWEGEIHEQCIISKKYNSAISLIWF